MPRKCRTTPVLFGIITQVGFLRVAQVWQHSPTAITPSSVVVGRWISRFKRNSLSRDISQPEQWRNVHDRVVHRVAVLWLMSDTWCPQNSCSQSQVNHVAQHHGDEVAGKTCNKLHLVAQEIHGLLSPCDALPLRVCAGGLNELGHPCPSNRRFWQHLPERPRHKEDGLATTPAI